MKPFLAVDITENKNNETINGSEFIVENVSQLYSQAFDTAAADAMNLAEKAKLPLPVRIVHWVCGFVGTILLIGIIRSGRGDDGITVAQAYQNAPWIFWASGICLAAWLVLTIIGRKREKETVESTEGDNTMRRLEAAADSIYEEFGVPATAEKVDVLGLTYKIKNGEPVAKEKGFNPTAYIFAEFRAYVQDGNLFLADLEHKYAFPLAELKAIRTVKKSIAASGWNKEVQPTKGEYKPYKMQADDFDCVHFKPYHILELAHNGEAWGIYFPCYELKAFEKLTGLTAEQ